MADYAASIRVNTKIDTKQAKAQLLSLENQMLKTSDKVDALNSKMKELEGRKSPGKDYQNLQTQLENANKELLKLVNKQNDLESIGIKSGSSWDAINEKVANAAIYVDDIKEKMYQMEAAGKAFTLGKDTKEYTKISQQLKYAQNDMSLLERKYAEAIAKMQASEQSFEQKSGNTFRKIADTAKKSFAGAVSFIQKGFAGVSNIIHKMGDTAKRVFGKLHKDTSKQNSLLATLKSRFSGIALSLLVFNWVTRGFNAMIASLKEGVQNLSLYSKKYNSVMSGLVSALANLKNAFTTAFAPIIITVIPYLTQLLNVLTAVINKVAQFIAALTGKSTWTKAKQQTIDYAESLGDISKEAKKAYTSLAAFDELNVLNKNEDSGSGAIKPEDMFEELPIDDKILGLTKKFKDILSKLFEPLKKAWDRQGKKVMDAWKYALKEVAKLIKAIGKDFLEVWTQEETVWIFEDILLIIADIGLIVGNLAKNFSEAWKASGTGKKILENIRDIIGVIIENIREAADKTVEWSDTLNFTPLLGAFERFTASFVKVADFLSGVLSDFYTQVLLPLGKWVLEKGLPDLLDIFTKFIDEVDWEGLRARLSEFWDHLAPFAETIGEGLILFIRDLSQILAKFINHPAFGEFLDKVEEWMANVTPEDVAKGLELICKAIIGYKVIKTIGAVFTSITSFLSFFGSTGAAGSATGIGAITKALGLLLPLLFAVSAFRSMKSQDNIGKTIDSYPKIEEYENLEDYNKALDDHKGKLEELQGGTWFGHTREEALEKFFGYGKGVSDGIVEGFNSGEEQANTLSSGLGENMANGFNEGFKNKSKDTDTLMKDFCKTTVDTVEDGLEINSPSKVFERIGKFLIQGLIQGIKSMGGNLQTTLMGVYGMVKNIMEKAKSIVSGMFSSIKEKAASSTSRVSAVWNAMPATYGLLRTSKNTSAAAYGMSEPSPGDRTTDTAKSASSAAYSYRMPELVTGGISTGTTIAKLEGAGHKAAPSLENNTGWMDKLAEKINGSGGITITAELDGDVLFKKTVERNEIFKKQNGHSAYVY